MDHAQIHALHRARELLGEHFDTAVIIVQPCPRAADIESAYVGSWHAIRSICELAQMKFSIETGDEEDAEKGEV